MGCCLCKGTPTIVLSREYLQQAIAAVIEEDKVQVLEQLYTNYMSKALLPYAIPVLDVEDPIAHIQGVDLNPLSYAFRLGRTRIARFLIEKANSSLSKLYHTFKLIGKTPLDVLCEHGHTDLLQYFLPKHLKRLSPDSPLVSYEESYEQLSIFADQSRATAVRPWKYPQAVTYTAIQRACQHSHLDTIKSILDFTKEHGTPHELDIHAEDEKTGENCALISCRLGNLQLVKFLYEECNANFHLLNKRNENAIQLSLVGAKKHKFGKYLETIKYLTERIQVDVLYHYEETLLMCEDKAIETYLEDKMRGFGVVIDKKKLEEDNAVQMDKSVRPEERDLEERLKEVGSQFVIKELFKQELEEKNYVSSISRHSLTPISRLSSITPVNE